MRETVTKLAGQTARLLNGIPLDEEETRLAFDVYPHQAPNLSNQLQRIFPQLDRATFHAIQVPVFYGLAQKVTALSDYDFDYQPQNSELVALEETLITPVLNGGTRKWRRISKTSFKSNKCGRKWRRILVCGR